MRINSGVKDRPMVAGLCSFALVLVVSACVIADEQYSVKISNASQCAVAFSGFQTDRGTAAVDRVVLRTDRLVCQIQLS
jgi:hypothetical protein